MKRILAACLAGILLTFTAGPVFTSEDRVHFPVVIMYHDIKTKPLNQFDVTVQDFCSQLDWLNENGYVTLSLEDFVSCLNNGEKFPSKSVIITFDDGYNGIYNYAVPELRKRGMKAAFCIITSVIDKTDSTSPHVTSQELREIAENEDFSIASHTLSHPHLNKLSPEDRVRELGESKSILEALTGRSVNVIAYPYGDYDADVIESVKLAGYEAAFAVQDRGLYSESPRYSIPRIYAGMKLAENDNELFKEYVNNYAAMPPEAFAERWQIIDQE